MPRFAAFLSRINVGTNQLKMADLRTVLESNGFSGVETVAASGNVVFDRDDPDVAGLPDRIASIIRSRFGIDCFAAVRSRAELARTIDESPFAASGEENRVHVFLLEGQPHHAAFDKLAADYGDRGNERIAAGTKALHVDFVDGVGRSKLTNPFIEKRLGCGATARNLRSLKRVLERMD